MVYGFEAVRRWDFLPHPRHAASAWQSIYSALFLPLPRTHPRGSGPSTELPDPADPQRSSRREPGNTNTAGSAAYKGALAATG